MRRSQPGEVVQRCGGEVSEQCRAGEGFLQEL